MNVMTVRQAEELQRRLHQTLETRHYSRRTLKSYSAWVHRFIRYHRYRHPAELGGKDRMDARAERVPLAQQHQHPGVVADGLERAMAGDRTPLELGGKGGLPAEGTSPLDLQLAIGHAGRAEQRAPEGRPPPNQHGHAHQERVN